VEGAVLESLALRAEELALEGAGVEGSAFLGAAGPLRALASVDAAHRGLGQSCQSWNAGCGSASPTYCDVLARYLPERCRSVKEPGACFEIEVEES